MTISCSSRWATRSSRPTGNGSRTPSPSSPSRTTAASRASGSRTWRAGPCASSRRVPDRIGSPAGRPTAAPSPSYAPPDTGGSGGCLRLAGVGRGADHGVPTIGTGGGGDGSVSPDGTEIARAMHGDSTVADNTSADVYLMGPDGSGMRALTTGRGADNTPRYSPDGKWLAYLSMERAGFEADRQRLMLVGRSDGRTGGPSVEATKSWTLSVGSYIWCPDSKCLYAVVEERGRDNIYRIDLPSFRRSLALGGGGVNTDVHVMTDGRGHLYLHQSNTQPNEIWLAGRQLTHHNDAALEPLDLRPLDESVSWARW